MINILFALIAVGAMCIDLILNRGVIDEINDEAEAHKKELNKAFALAPKKKKNREYIDTCNDKIEALINKLQVETKKGCASSRARPFYYSLVILTICVVISALSDKCYEAKIVDEIIYSYLGIIGTGVWIATLFFYLWSFFRILKMSYAIEQKRRQIRENVEKTMLNVRLMSGDPTFPLDLKE